MKGREVVDERKLKILAAIVDEYVRTGEPVGSKAISKLDNIKVSAATIRNDMAALEQLGYLEQPHTSAGRIPSDKGYRLYVDELLLGSMTPSCRMLFPAGTKANACFVKGNVLYLDLSEEALQIKSNAEVTDFTAAAEILRKNIFTNLYRR